MRSHSCWHERKVILVYLLPFVTNNSLNGTAVTRVHCCDEGAWRSPAGGMEDWRCWRRPLKGERSGRTEEWGTGGWRPEEGLSSGQCPLPVARWCREWGDHGTTNPLPPLHTTYSLHWGSGPASQPGGAGAPPPHPNPHFPQYIPMEELCHEPLYNWFVIKINLICTYTKANLSH